jgi:hypothetical protein
MTAHPTPTPACLFCGGPVGPAEPRCAAFARAGVAAHQRCCGCQGWASWTRPDPAPPGPVEEAC